MKEISELLRKARIAKGLSLKKVAEETGISFTTINSWERAVCVPKTKNRRIISKYYGLAESDLIDMSMPEGERKSPSLLTDYEPRPIMMHRERWKMAVEMQNDYDVFDVSAVMDRLVSEAWKRRNKG